MTEQRYRVRWAHFLLIAGGTCVAVSVFADKLGLGSRNDEFGLWQICGVTVGVIALTTGVWFARFNHRGPPVFTVPELVAGSWRLKLFPVGVALIVGGIVTSLVAWWWLDELVGFAAKRGKGQEAVAVVFGLTVSAVGIAMVTSGLRSDRTSRNHRIGAGIAVLLSGVLWVNSATIINFHLDCRFSCDSYGLLNVDWTLWVAFHVAATMLTLWAFIGLWRDTGISTRVALIVFWSSVASPWIVRIATVFKVS